MIDDSSITIQFGEPISVLDQPITEYLGVFQAPAGNYFLPPVSMTGLSKMRNANAYHGSALIFRRNILSSAYVQNKILSLNDFRNCEFDLLTFGNAYVQLHYNIIGTLIKMTHVPALNMRVMGDFTQFMMLNPFQNIYFQTGEILQLKEYDTQQQVYGIPDWMSALQSALLNQDATLFRRKYYKNGCHIGYVFYTSDPSLSKDAQEKIKEAVGKGKGIGNFRSMYVHIPHGKEKSVQIVPVGDISQKDEFQNVKSISANDVLAAHRVPPQLMAIKPENTGGFGDPEKTLDVYVKTEVTSMAQPWLNLNEVLPARAQIKFDFERIMSNRLISQGNGNRGSGTGNTQNSTPKTQN